MTEELQTPTALVVVFPRGQLSPDDKATLAAGGILAVEADDPQSVQQLHLTAPMVTTRINGDAIVMAALLSLAEYAPETSGGSITGVGRACHSFVSRLAKSLEAAS